MTRTQSPLAAVLLTGIATPAPALRRAAELLLRDADLLLPVGAAAPIEAALGGLPHLPPAARIGEAIAALASYAPSVLLLHDAAFGGIPAGSVASLLAALLDADAAVPARPVSGMLTEVQPDGRKGATRSSSGLHLLGSPVALRFAAASHLAAAQGTADAVALLESAGCVVALVPGREDRVLLPRVGIGYDVHVLEPGRRLMLCGVEVPHRAGLAGHSDADVGIHALCDAIYGALAEGDIGRHFPPSEAAWKDADSARFLTHAAGRIAARGGVLANADVTLICEQPRITPHAPRMVARLADLLGVAPGRISVKATTTERLGFTGRMEGIAAQAVATVLLPAD